MYLSRITETIIKLLQIPGIGNRMADIIAKRLVEEQNWDDLSLKDLINFYNRSGYITLKKEITDENIEKAIDKSNKIIDESENLGINIISKFDNTFPLSLKSIIDNKNKDISPIILNYLGDIKKIANHKSIAIVGTRKPTCEGIEACTYYSKYFAKKEYNIVSGLALGCDSIAHNGALSVHGMTTAILAHGLHMVSPKSNEKLAREILDNGGLLLSEYFVGTPAFSTFFVERDRLQAGLSLATIVIQAGIKSGTMHAARTAINNNRLLACVRYKDDIVRNQECVQGNNLLIRQGAYSLRRVEDFENFMDSGNTLEYKKMDFELKFD